MIRVAQARVVPLCIVKVFTYKKRKYFLHRKGDRKGLQEDVETSKNKRERGFAIKGEEVNG